MRKPAKKLKSRWNWELAVITLLLGGIFLAVPSNWYQAASLYFWLPLIIGAVVLAGILYINRRYAAWGFEMREDHLYIQHGVFKRIKTMAPFVRLQHVDTQRGVLDRLFGLSKVVVYTAGSRGADITIPGLFPEEAEDIQEKLRDVAIESEDRDAV